MPRDVRPGENHHWWPRRLGVEWSGDDELIEMYHRSGDASRVPAHKAARISDGHNVVHDTFTWSFEEKFDLVDSSITTLLDWAQQLRLDVHKSENRQNGWRAHQAPDQGMVDALCRLVASLCIRSPKTRGQAEAFVSHMRGDEIAKREKKNLIAANLFHSFDLAEREMIENGKLGLLFSTGCDFVFGDGFLNTVPYSATHFSPYTEAVVPLTPRLAVIYVLPPVSRNNAKLHSTLAACPLVEMVNAATISNCQNHVFYRSHSPSNLSVMHFGVATKKAISKNVSDRLVYSIPGVQRDYSF